MVLPPPPWRVATQKPRLSPARTVQGQGQCAQACKAPQKNPHTHTTAKPHDLSSAMEASASPKTRAGKKHTHTPDIIGFSPARRRPPPAQKRGLEKHTPTLDIEGSRVRTPGLGLKDSRDRVRVKDSKSKKGVRVNLHREVKALRVRALGLGLTSIVRLKCLGLGLEACSSALLVLFGLRFQYRYSAPTLPLVRRPYLSSRQPHLAPALRVHPPYCALLTLRPAYFLWWNSLKLVLAESLRCVEHVRLICFEKYKGMNFLWIFEEVRLVDT